MVDAGDLAPELQPSEIAERAFSTIRRGYDPSDVRAFLEIVAEAHRALLARAAAPDDRAAAIIAAAEERAAEVLRDAQDEARRMLAGVGDERQRGFDEGAARAEAVLAEAETARARIEAEAHREAERLVAEAEAARSKVLRDLRRRRKTARTHLEQLQAARERLLIGLAEVRTSIEATTAGLRDALPEAKAAADAAARRVAAEEELTVEQLEGEIQALRMAGLPLLPADDHVYVEPAAVENGTGEANGERRSSAVRIVRPMRPQHPVSGLPAEELRPLEAQDPDETVRLVTVEELSVAAVDPVVALAPTPVSEPEAAPAPELELHADEPVETAVEADAVEAKVEADAEAEVEAEVEVEADVETPVEAVAEVAEAAAVVDEHAAPMPAAEPETVAEPESPVAGRPSPAAVDALFARLKSGRAERVAEAEAVFEQAPVAVVDDVEGDVEEGVDEPEASDEEVTVHRGGGASRAVLLARRDAAIAPVVGSLARRLKRMLAAEQYELLDELRRRGTAGALVPTGQHGSRWAAEAAVDLAVAASAGAAYLDPAGETNGYQPSPGDLVEVAEQFAEQFAAPLHQRLEQVLTASEDDAEIAGESIRSVYRTWRADRLGPAVEHAVLDAFAAGVAARCAPGTPVCWIVDDGGSPCPDAEDNSLAGSLGCGEAFPTGHARPPAHPGCRCVLVPVSATD